MKAIRPEPNRGFPVPRLRSANLLFMQISHWIAVSALVCASPLSMISQQTAASGDAASRVTAQNALFEEYYEQQLKNSPQTATAFGDYRYNDQLDDESIAAEQRVHA